MEDVIRDLGYVGLFALLLGENLFPPIPSIARQTREEAADHDLGLEAGEAAPEGTEELAVRWVALDDALAMVERGEITDSLTQLGLLAVARERAVRGPGTAPGR